MDTLEQGLPTQHKLSSMDLHLALSQPTNTYDSEEEAANSQYRSDTVIPNSDSPKQQKAQKQDDMEDQSMDLHLTNTLNAAEYQDAALSSDKPQQQVQQVVEKNKEKSSEEMQIVKKKIVDDDVSDEGAAQTLRTMAIVKTASPKKYAKRLSTTPPKKVANRRASASREMKELEQRAKREALRDVMRTSPMKQQRNRKSLTTNDNDEDEEDVATTQQEDEDEGNDEMEDAMDVDSPTPVRGRKKKLTPVRNTGWTPKATSKQNNQHLLSDTEPTTEERDVPLHKRKKLFFEGVKFVLTGNVDKNKLKDQITNAGGQVMELSNSMVPSEIEAMRNVQIVLVADKPARTFKYMFALAMDMPLVIPKWIDDSVKNNTCLHPVEKRYCLNHGTLISGETYEQDERDSFYPATANEGIFFNFKVLVSGDTEFMSSWKTILLAAGATFAHSESELFKSTRPMYICEKKPSNSVLERCTKHKVAVYSYDYVIMCLIADEVLPLKKQLREMCFNFAALNKRSQETNAQQETSIVEQANSRTKKESSPEYLSNIGAKSNSSQEPPAAIVPPPQPVAEIVAPKKVAKLADLKKKPDVMEEDADLVTPVNQPTEAFSKTPVRKRHKSISKTRKFTWIGESTPTDGKKTYKAFSDGTNTFNLGDTVLIMGEEGRDICYIRELFETSHVQYAHTISFYTRQRALSHSNAEEEEEEANMTPNQLCLTSCEMRYKLECIKERVHIVAPTKNMNASNLFICTEYFNYVSGSITPLEQTQMVWTNANNSDTSNKPVQPKPAFVWLGSSKQRQGFTWYQSCVLLGEHVKVSKYVRMTMKTGEQICGMVESMFDKDGNAMFCLELYQESTTDATCLMEQKDIKEVLLVDVIRVEKLKILPSVEQVLALQALEKFKGRLFYIK